MKKENIAFLEQLISSLEEAELKLGKAYEKRDYEKFNKIKNNMLQIQEQISKRIK